MCMFFVGVSFVWACLLWVCHLCGLVICVGVYFAELEDAVVRPQGHDAAVFCQARRQHPQRHHQPGAGHVCHPHHHLVIRSHVGVHVPEWLDVHVTCINAW